MTTYGLTTGAIEQNPLVKPLGLTGFVVLKSLTIYLVYKLMEQPLTKEDRKIVNKVFIILDIYYLAIITNNVYQMSAR